MKTSGQASAGISDAAAAEIVIPEGSVLRVRTGEPLNTRRNRAGDSFRGTLIDAVVVDGREVVPAGVEVAGHVTNSAEAGRVKGRAVIGLTLDSIVWQGREYHLQTTRVVRQGPAPRNRLIALIAGGSGLGAIIGAFTGGGKGAAIGAAAGGAAGFAGAEATGKEDVGLPSEAAVTFALRSPVRL